MALELFKPFVISWLITNEYAHNIRSATRLIEAGEAVVWDALDECIKGKYVLLNRAPSLHRLSIQSFMPVLVEGKAIQLHPLVATGFNADYDGDQMAVHLPLSDEAQAEARDLMSATNNLLKPADGSPVLNINQDVVLGNYYLTYEKPAAQTDKVQVFANSRDAELAYDMGKLQLQAPIRIRAKGEVRNTTLGRVFFNEILPEDFPYNNNIQNKKELKKVLAQIFDKYGAEETATIADRMKGLAFRFATTSAVSTSMTDYLNFEEVSDFVKEGDERAAVISDQYDEGLITDEERYTLTVNNWRSVDGKVETFLKDQLAHMDTSVSTMVNSGARGTAVQLRFSLRPRAARHALLACFGRSWFCGRRGYNGPCRCPQRAGRFVSGRYSCRAALHAIVQRPYTAWLIVLSCLAPPQCRPSSTSPTPPPLPSKTAPRPAGRSARRPCG